MKKKPVALLLSGVLILGCTVGGTLAWLTAESETVNNTFTVGNIEIKLDESTLNDNGTLDATKRVKNNTYRMTPGVTLAKDPTVTVMAGSEDCYVFIEVKEDGYATATDGEFPSPQVYLFGEMFSYEIADGWTKLEKDRNGNDLVGIYYREVLQSTDDIPYKILKDDQITVNDTITKTMMQSITDDNQPTLTFTAYAVQMYQTNTAGDDADKFSAADAWAQVAKQN